MTGRIFPVKRHERNQRLNRQKSSAKSGGAHGALDVLSMVSTDTDDHTMLISTV